MINAKQCYVIDEEGRIHFDDEAFKSFIIDVIISRTTMELETTAGTIVDRVGRLKIFYGKAVPDIKYVRAIKDHIYKILMRMRNEEILIEKHDGYYGEVYFVSDDYVEKQTQDFSLDEARNDVVARARLRRQQGRQRQCHNIKNIPAMKARIIRRLSDGEEIADDSLISHIALTDKVDFCGKVAIDFSKHWEFITAVIDDMIKDNIISVISDEWGDRLRLSDSFISKDVSDFTLDESTKTFSWKAEASMLDNDYYCIDKNNILTLNDGKIKDLIIYYVTHGMSPSGEPWWSEDLKETIIYKYFNNIPFRSRDKVWSALNRIIENMIDDHIIFNENDPDKGFILKFTNDYLERQVQDFTLDESVEFSNQPPIYSIDKHRDVTFIKENIKEIILNILINATYRNEYYEKHVVTADVVDIAERTGHKIGWPPNYANFLTSLRNAVYNAIDELVEANILTYIVDDFDTGAHFLQLSDAYIAKQTENFNLDESKSHDLSFKQKIINNIIDLLSEQPVVEKDQIKYWVIPTHDADDPVYIDPNNYEIADAIIEELIDNGMIVYADDTDTSLRELVSLSDDYFSEEVSDFNLDEAVKKSSHSKIFSALKKDGTLDKVRKVTTALKNAKHVLSEVVKDELGVMITVEIAHVNQYVDSKNWQAQFTSPIIRLIDDEENKIFNDEIFSKFDDLDKILVEIGISLIKIADYRSFFNVYVNLGSFINFKAKRENREDASDRQRQFDKIINLVNCKSYDEFPDSLKNTITYMFETGQLKPDIEDFNLD